MVEESKKSFWSSYTALFVAVILYALFMIVYLSNTDLPFIRFKADVASWGQFGDYVGGVINPLVGLITIWLLTQSLKQSQQEMALTRKALEDAEASQKATEAALREQIAIADQAKDMNNAIALWAHLDVSCVNINKKIEMENQKTKNRDQGTINECLRDFKNTAKSRDDIGKILSNETNRLRTKYLHND